MMYPALFTKGENMDIQINKSTCPNCNHRNDDGGLQVWQIVISIIFFPIGLLSILVKKDVHCRNCNYVYKSGVA
jgi:DNA-directed RNA polymerase subunit RPC12/RpoP